MFERPGPSIIVVKLPKKPIFTTLAVLASRLDTVYALLVTGTGPTHFLGGNVAGVLRGW